MRVGHGLVFRGDVSGLGFDVRPYLVGFQGAFCGFVQYLPEAVFRPVPERPGPACGFLGAVVGFAQCSDHAPHLGHIARACSPQNHRQTCPPVRRVCRVEVVALGVCDAHRFGLFDRFGFVKIGGFFPLAGALDAEFFGQSARVEAHAATQCGLCPQPLGGGLLVADRCPVEQLREGAAFAPGGFGAVAGHFVGGFEFRGVVVQATRLEVKPVFVAPPAHFGHGFIPGRAHRLGHFGGVEPLAVREQDVQMGVQPVGTYGGLQRFEFAQAPGFRVPLRHPAVEQRERFMQPCDDFRPIVAVGVGHGEREKPPSHRAGFERREQSAAQPSPRLCHAAPCAVVARPDGTACEVAHHARAVFR